jgi:hypothetical protein
MIKLRYLLFAGLLSLAACTEKLVSTPDCVTGDCFLNFVSITVKFVDKSGQQVTVQNYQVVNLRTGKAVEIIGPHHVLSSSGYHYTIANDSNLKDFSEQGDKVRVTATNPATGQSVTAEYVIKGGCVCHIEKVSGPEQVVFTQ